MTLLSNKSIMKRPNLSNTCVSFLNGVLAVPPVYTYVYTWCLIIFYIIYDVNMTKIIWSRLMKLNNVDVEQY